MLTWRLGSGCCWHKVGHQATDAHMRMALLFHQHCLEACLPPLFLGNSPSRAGCAPHTVGLIDLLHVSAVCLHRPAACWV